MKYDTAPGSYTVVVRDSDPKRYDMTDDGYLTFRLFVSLGWVTVLLHTIFEP